MWWRMERSCRVKFLFGTTVAWLIHGCQTQWWPVGDCQSGRFNFWTTAHIVAEEISGGTKVRKLYPPAGCLGFKQTLLTPAGAYRCYQYRDDSGDTSGYWYNSYSGWSDGYIFDESPCGPEPVPEKVASRDISGFLSFDSGYGSSSNSTCRINGGNNYEVWAFQMYSHNSAYDIVYEWQCP